MGSIGRGWFGRLLGVPPGLLLSFESHGVSAQISSLFFLADPGKIWGCCWGWRLGEISNSNFCPLSDEDSLPRTCVGGFLGSPEGGRGDSNH